MTSRRGRHRRCSAPCRAARPARRPRRCAPSRPSSTDRGAVAAGPGSVPSRAPSPPRSGQHHEQQGQRTRCPVGTARRPPRRVSGNRAAHRAWCHHPSRPDRPLGTHARRLVAGAGGAAPAWERGTGGHPPSVAVSPAAPGAADPTGGVGCPCRRRHSASTVDPWTPTSDRDGRSPATQWPVMNPSSAPPPVARPPPAVGIGAAPGVHRPTLGRTPGASGHVRHARRPLRRGRRTAGGEDVVAQLHGDAQPGT